MQQGFIVVVDEWWWRRQQILHVALSLGIKTATRRQRRHRHLAASAQYRGCNRGGYVQLVARADTINNQRQQRRGDQTAGPCGTIKNEVQMHHLNCKVLSGWHHFRCTLMRRSLLRRRGTIKINGHKRSRTLDGM